MEGARNNPSRDSRLPSPSNPDRARLTVFRYFASGATREQIPKELVRRLDEIRGIGVRSFTSLKAYPAASVFVLATSQDLATDTSDTIGEASVGVSSLITKQLNAASEKVMARMFINYPETDNSHLETTCTISAMFFLSAVARFGPELIFESLDSAKDKAELADQFIQFYDREIARFMENEGTQWTHARQYHGAVLDAYNQFKSEMPELFKKMQQKVGIIGEFMTPYGQYVNFNWASHYYNGSL